jgi:predicted nucleotidyltransferase component of viral defense system
VDYDIADLEIVLTYVLQFLTGRGHGERMAFKGGTALRKLVFGPGGRFSVDLDFVALDETIPPPEDRLFDELAGATFSGIELGIKDLRESQQGSFEADATYRHPGGEGRFKIQVSHRRDVVIPAQPQDLAYEPYFERLEFAPSPVVSLHRFEMLAEKVLACQRRVGGSAKDIYDLYQFANIGFDNALLTSLTCLKAWTDQVDFSPREFLRGIDPSMYEWAELGWLVRRAKSIEREHICERVRERYNVLAKLSPLDKRVLADTRLHRDKDGYDELADEVRAKAAALRG